MPKVDLETGEIGTLLDGLDQLLEFGMDDAWYAKHLAEVRRKLLAPLSDLERDELEDA